MSNQNTRRTHPFSLPAGLMIVLLAIAGSAIAQNHATPGPDAVSYTHLQKFTSSDHVPPARLEIIGVFSRTREWTLNPAETYRRNPTKAASGFSCPKSLIPC